MQYTSKHVSWWNKLSSSKDECIIESLADLTLSCISRHTRFFGDVQKMAICQHHRHPIAATSTDVDHPQHIHRQHAAIAMAATDPGEEFWDNPAAGQENLDPDASDAWAHKHEEFDDEADNSSGFGTSNLQVDCSFNLSFAPTTTELADEEVPGGSASNPSEVSFCKKNHFHTSY